jgi:predicted enzyme related to lactoylglutathione lyase
MAALHQHHKGNAMKRLINWFEIPVAELDRAVRFYETVFAVRLRLEEMNGMKMGVFPYEQGATGGALLACKEGKPGDHGVLIYLDGGSDLATPLGRVAAAGGRILMEKTLIDPHIGHIAMFADSEGNRIGLHSPA